MEVVVSVAPQDGCMEVEEGRDVAEYVKQIIKSGQSVCVYCATSPDFAQLVVTCATHCHLNMLHPTIPWLEPFDFYGRDSCLSNFSAHRVRSARWGVTFPNAEAYFHAFKLGDTPTALELKPYLRDVTPSTIKSVGRRSYLRPDWEEVKYDRMVEILRDKVACNPDVKQFLLALGIRPIFEHTSRDWVWGDGGDSRRGRNLLGKAWAEVRTTLW